MDCIKHTRYQFGSISCSFSQHRSLENSYNYETYKNTLDYSDSYCSQYFNKSENKKIKFPIFILFFILASIVATIINLPAIYSLLTQVGKMMLSLALYMIGTSLNIQAIKKMTGKNLLYGITLWIFSIISGYMIMMFL